jgi:hypothetical protein
LSQSSRRITPIPTAVIAWKIPWQYPGKLVASAAGERDTQGRDTSNSSLQQPSRIDAIGFQTNFILPVKALNFFFKFEDEYRAFARPEGRTIAFGGSYTFRIPKLQAPPSGPEAPATP